MATGGEVLDRLPCGSGSDPLSQPICQPCLENDNITEAVGICVDCEDYVCFECFDGHMVRQHRLLDREHMFHGQTKAFSVKDFCTDSCPVHEDEVIQYYCTSHCHLGCKTCITLDHTHCEEVNYIPQIARDLANHTDYRLIESQLKSVLSALMGVFRKAQCNSDEVNKSCEDALTRLQDFKRLVSDVLIIFEKKLDDQLKTLRLRADQEIAELRNKYKAAYRELQSSLAKIEALQSANQSCRSYTEMMRMKEKLKSLEDLKQKAEVDNSYRKGRIQFTANRELMQILRTPGGLGTVYSVDTQNIISGSDEVSVSVLSDTETGSATSETDDSSHDQIGSTFSDDISVITDPELGRSTIHEWLRTVSVLLGSNTEGILSGSQVYHVLDLKVKTARDIYRCSITGMVVLPDNRLVLTDFLNASIKLVDVHDNQVMPQLKIYIRKGSKLASKPWDITTIQRNMLAVTLPIENKIAFVSVEDNDINVERLLAVDGQCRGIDHRNDRLAVSFCDPDKVQILSLQGSVLYSIDDTLGQALFQCPRFLTFGPDDTTLYVSNFTGHSVVCVNLDGTVVSAYTNMNLKNPAKAVVDSNGNVYVCNNGSHTICQITKDFKTVRLQLTHADGLDRHKSICLSEEEDTLYVWMMLS